MILITGSTGTVGGEVLKRLSAAEIETRAATRNPAKTDGQRLPHVTYVQADFSDLESVQRACEGVERAFLLTNSTEQAQQQQIDFVRIAKAAGVKHIVKLSQLRADPDSPARFLQYHAAVEQAIAESGLAYTFLRPNLYMQALLGFRDMIQKRSAFFASVSDARVSAVDVRDLADVAVAALTRLGHEGRSYPLTGPQAVSFREMAACLSATVGRTITYTHSSPEAMRAVLTSFHFPEWQAEGLLEEFAMYRRGEAEFVESGVQQALGRRARSFADFARDYAHAFK